MVKRKFDGFHLLYLKDLLNLLTIMMYKFMELYFIEPESHYFEMTEYFASIFQLAQSKPHYLFRMVILKLSNDAATMCLALALTTIIDENPK